MGAGLTAELTIEAWHTQMYYASKSASCQISSLERQTHRHPPNPPSRLCESIKLSSSIMQRQIHRHHQSLTCSIPHLCDITPLRILIHTEYAQRNHTFQLHRYSWVESRSWDMWVSIHKSLCWWDWRIRHLGVTFYALNCALGKVVCGFSASFYAVFGEWCALFRVWYQSQDCGDSQTSWWSWLKGICWRFRKPELWVVFWVSSFRWWEDWKEWM